MKFGFSVFIGIFLVLLGVSIFLEQFLRIDLPLGKLFLAGSFIYIGYQLIKTRLLQQHKSAQANEAPPMEFGEHNVKASAEVANQTFKYIFSSGTIDLRELPETLPQPITIQAIFSDVKIWIRNNQAIQLESKSVFGSVTQPNKQAVHFGRHTLNIPHNATNTTVLKVHCRSIFSSIIFEYPQPPPKS